MKQILIHRVRTWADIYFRREHPTPPYKLSLLAPICYVVTWRDVTYRPCRATRRHSADCDRRCSCRPRWSPGNGSWRREKLSSRRTTWRRCRSYRTVEATALQSSIRRRIVGSRVMTTGKKKMMVLIDVAGTSWRRRGLTKIYWLHHRVLWATWRWGWWARGTSEQLVKTCLHRSTVIDREVSA